VDIFELHGDVYRWSARGFRDAMDAGGWTGDALAARLRVSPQAVSYWRQGVAKPRAATMARLVKALGDHAAKAIERVGQ